MTSCPKGMRAVQPESMNCGQQDTKSHRPVGRCLSATAFSKLIRRPGRPMTFHATGALTLPSSLSPLSPPATATLLNGFQSPATTGRFATQIANIMPLFRHQC